MLTEMGRRLVDACENCENLGVESINNGIMILRCDQGKFSSCIQKYSSFNIPPGYI